MLVLKIDLLISGSGQFSFKVFDFTRFFQIAALQISQTRYFIIKLHKFLELFTLVEHSVSALKSVLCV